MSCGSCGYTSNEERATGIIPATPVKAATKFRNSEAVPKWIESLDIVPRSAVRINPKFQFGVMKVPAADESLSEKCTLVAVATSSDRDVNEIKLSKAVGNVELVGSVQDVQNLLEDSLVTDLMLCVDQSLYPGQESPRPKDITLGGSLPEGLLPLVGSKNGGGGELGSAARVVYGDYHNCKPGDGCPHCQKNRGVIEPMEITRAIEVGHTFMLGTKYSVPLNATFVPVSGQGEEPIQMGCYGLGITRLLASIVEASHDHKGIIWPESVAPFRVVIVTSEDEACVTAAENVYDVVQKALNAKAEVILDDRTETTLGFKMKDAELIGYPWMVVVGKGFLRTGSIEVQQRKTGEKWTLEWPKISEFFEERRLLQ